jgi:hypothetical protein
LARMCATAAVAGLWTLSSLPPLHAQSAPVPVDLTWQAPPECPSREAVLAEIARLLSPSRNPRIPATATVHVEREQGARWRGALSLEARDSHSERTLETENCDAVAAAAALVIAIAVEGGVPPPPIEPASLSPASPPKPQPADRPPPARVTEASPPPPTSQLVLSAAGVADVATMPSPPAPGAEVGVGWSPTFSFLRLRALGTASFYPAEGVTSAQSGEGGHFWLFAASARACAGIVRGSVDIGPCLGGEVALMSASGEGHGVPGFRSSDAVGLWGSALGGVLASWSLSRSLALFARADALLSLDQPSFVLVFPSRNDLVYRPSVWAGRGAFGLELRFF